MELNPMATNIPALTGLYSGFYIQGSNMETKHTVDPIITITLNPIPTVATSSQAKLYSNNA